MTSKQRAYLKSLAHELQPVVQIGKDGVTPEAAESVREAFNNRELLKVQVQKNCFDDLQTIADTLAGRTRSQVVQVIGRKIVLYKPDPKNPKIVLPKAAK